MVNFSTNIYTVSEKTPKHHEAVLVKINGIGFWTMYTYNDNTKFWENTFTGKIWSKVNEKDKWFYLPEE